MSNQTSKPSNKANSPPLKAECPPTTGKGILHHTNHRALTEALSLHRLSFHSIEEPYAHRADYFVCTYRLNLSAL